MNYLHVLLHFTPINSDFIWLKAIVDGFSYYYKFQKNKNNDRSDRVVVSGDRNVVWPKVYGLKLLNTKPIIHFI